ncbi:MAG: PaaI family thioesterase [Candidatus Kapabacteria bacterium]|nr:PaaI family thioesterase [Candidatus Kapabacteria bacterium]MCX7937384.1 PaaI family thioesterase [Chlorobiota bacterium]
MKKAWNPENPNYLDRILSCLERQAFMRHIGCEVTNVQPGFVEARIQISDFHKQHDGLLHGGVIATLADIVAGFAVHTLVNKDVSTVTIDMMISFLEACRNDYLIARGNVVRHGRTTSFAQAVVFASTNGVDPELLIATAQATFALRQLPP